MNEKEAFVMSEKVLAKLTSPKWLREAIGGRARIFVDSLNFSPFTIEREVAGEKYNFYIGSALGKSWYNSKIDNSYEMEFVRRHLLKPGAVVIECGAHHGAQSILLSRWVGPQGKVVAVEPMPENVSILNKNIEINRLSNVIVVEKAVGRQDNQLSMALKSNASVRPGGKHTISVGSITLDALAEKLKIMPTLLKIDVEGYEYEILEGSRSILATTPAVFVEVHTLTLQRYGRKFEDLWKFIDPNNYDIFVQDEDYKEPEPYVPTIVPTGRIHMFFRPRRQ
jgi:FkbM family methyltransferase